MFLFLIAFLMTQSSWSAHSSVYIYNDEGAGQRSVLACKNAFTWAAPHVVKEIKADEVICGEWKNDAVAFVMPGGADLPYCKKLNGDGNRAIKEYVENGGVYFGFCAGAYYGSGYCDFYRGDVERGYEVLGERELSFFQGPAVGPTLAQYVYGSEEGARIAEIELVEPKTILHRVYFDGGCHFPDADKYDGVKVLGYYTNSERRIPEYSSSSKLPAIIECQVGRGVAILSGVHPEYSAEIFEVDIPGKTKSQLDVLILKDRIIPVLSDRSHVFVFKSLMSRIRR